MLRLSLRVTHYVPPAVVTIYGPVAGLDNITFSPSLWKEDGRASGKEALLGSNGKEAWDI